MIATIIILLAFVIHGIAKGYADGIWFGWQYLKYAPQWMIDWILRDPEGKHNGNPLKCDLWHFADGHVMQGTLCLGVIGGTMFGVSLWILPLVWFGYWLEGRVFVYVFHVWLMKDWDFKYWMKDTVIL